MSGMKAYWDSVALREFGVVNEDTLTKALPIAQAELDALKRKEGMDFTPSVRKESDNGDS